MAKILILDALLTRRQLEVLALVADGLSNKEIASKLVLEPVTIKNHMKNIYHALDVHDRLNAVIQAVKLGYIQVQWKSRKK